MGVRECPFCGKKISDAFRDCPYCHEAVPELRRTESSSPASERNGPLRRGLLYMMVVAFVYYLLSPSSPLKIPVPFAPVLTNYVLPLCFVAGLGFALYGIFFHVKR